MSAGLTLLFTSGNGGKPATLIAASVYDDSPASTTFTEGVSEDMREGWAQNVLGKWEHATDKSPENVGELIAYNMILPVAYEEFGSRDEAQARADELISTTPPITAQQYIAQRPAQDQQTAGGTE